MNNPVSFQGVLLQLTSLSVLLKGLSPSVMLEHFKSKQVQCWTFFEHTDLNTQTSAVHTTKHTYIATATPYLYALQTGQKGQSETRVAIEFCVASTWG